MLVFVDGTDLTQDMPINSILETGVHWLLGPQMKYRIAQNPQDSYSSPCDTPPRAL